MNKINNIVSIIMFSVGIVQAIMGNNDNALVCIGASIFLSIQTLITKGEPDTE